MRGLEVTIGVLSLIGAYYFFRQFWRYKKYGPTCDISSGSDIISKASRKLKNIFDGGSSTVVVILSILVFSAIVTIVEFPCSAAIPVIFAGMLAQSDLSGINHLFYILIFIIFYLLDELIVFFVAVFKMKMWLSSSRFTTWAAFVGGLILLLFGFYYLFGLI